MVERLQSNADVTLAAELQRNARQTNRALAQKVGLAASTTLARVRDLESSGVVRGYHAEVDLAALGRPIQALIFVRLQPKTDEMVNGFIDAVWELPEVIGLDLISGIEDAVIHVAVPDIEALNRVVRRKISSQPGVFDERTSLLFDHRRKAVVEPLEPTS